MPPLTDHLGEIAALGAAMCWVFTSLSFAAAGRRIGPTAVNFLRIFLALAALLLITRLFQGAWLPAIDTRALLLLGLSGLIGLTIGDQLLFTALVDVGPRVSTLLMTLALLVAAILAWPLLDEPLTWVTILGMTVTLSGIVWVVLERPRGRRGATIEHRHRARGVIFGAAAGCCQALGLVLSKLGMGHIPGRDTPRVDPWTATMYRMAFAAAGIIVLATLVRRFRRDRNGTPSIEVSVETEHLSPAPTTDQRKRIVTALGFVLIGATFGPVLGVGFSMEAVDRTDAGIAATIMAMTPVLILPFAVWVEKERISWRAAIGAMVAVAGVALLALASRSS